jgi:intron-binding protein aquarius
MLKFYTGFEINDQTGNALTENEMTTIHYDRITSLQVTSMHMAVLKLHEAV